MLVSRTFIAATLLAAVVSLTACNGRSHTYINVSHGNVVLHDGYVTIQADDAPSAKVSADGALRIGSRDIDVDSNQRQLLRQYYSDAERIGHQGVEVGKAGAHMAGGTIGDVFSNLFSGHPDKIDADVRKRTDHLLAQVSQICEGLQSMQATQDTLAGQLDAFRPYARIQAADVQECRQDIAKARREAAHSD